MPHRLPSQFQDDLQGKQHRLHQLDDIVNSYLTAKGKKPEDIDGGKMKYLTENIGKGVTGLEYLTGLKKNKVNTFHDEHPVQSTIRDLLNKSPYLGAGIAASGIGVNAMREHHNLNTYKKIEDNVKDPNNSEVVRSLHGEHPLPDDVAEIFGDLKSNNPDFVNNRVERLDSNARTMAGHNNQPEPESLLDLLDQVRGKQQAAQNFDPKQTPEYSAAVRKAQGLKAKQTEFSTLRHSETMRKGLANRPNYSHFTPNELKGFFGDQHAAAGRELGDLERKISNPDQLTGNRRQQLSQEATEGMQGLMSKATSSPGNRVLDSHMKLYNLAREAEKHEFKSPLFSGGGDDEALSQLFGSHLRDSLGHDNPVFDRKILRKIFEKTRGAKGQGAVDSLMNRTLDIAQKPRSRMSDMMRIGKAPLMAGAAVGAGGFGLGQIMKMIQSKVYGPEKMKEWTNNLHASKGDFHRMSND